MREFTIIGLIMLATIVFAKNETLEQRLRDDPDLSQVYFF